MVRLNLPTRDGALDELLTALTYANGNPKYAITERELQQIEALYNEYENRRGVANETLSGSHLSQALKKAVLDGYSEVQEGRRLADLRSRLLLNAKLCPCCGILIPDQLDHYLPESVYPALAVYSSNLVPYCHKCNNKKRTVDGTTAQGRFVHVYYDDIPNDVQFFFANISIVDDGLHIDFEIREVPGLPLALKRDLEFQLARVNFVARASKELNIFISSFAYYIKSDFEAGGREAVQLGLSHSLNHIQQEFGLNNWRPAIIQGLVSNDEFCDGGFYGPLSLPR